MKSRQLLSVVFSLIMVSGISAGSVAYGQSNDLEEIEDTLEDFCELNATEKREFFSDYPEYVKYDERLAKICDIKDKNEREKALDALVDEAIPDTRDENESEMSDDEIHEDLDDRLERFCELTDDAKNTFFAEHPRIAQFKDRLVEFCNIEDEDEREDTIDAFIDELIPETRNNIDEYLDKYSNKGNLHEHLLLMCDMTSDDKSKFMEMISDLPDDIHEKIATFCEMTKDQQKEFLDSIHDRMDEFKDEHKMFIREMQEIHEKISDHKAEYERFCKLSEDQRVLEIDNPEKLAKISEWCNMTPEERDAFKKEHHDTAMDFKEKHHDALERMKEKKDLSHRLKDLILDDDENSDEKISELKEKLKEKSREYENKKSELKEKFRENKSELKFRFSELTEQRKSDIRERHQEMKEFKLELLTKSDALTNEEKQELRAEFIEKAKDMQLAWITPRDQMSAGIDPDQIECREGFSLVMKNSNGLPMCVKTHTAIKMIEKGYAVPVEPAN